MIMEIPSNLPIFSDQYFSKMSNQTRLVLLHILSGVAFLSLPVLFSPGHGSLAERIGESGYVRDLFGYAFALLFFYLNYLILIPKFYFKRKYGWYSFLVLCSFVLLMYHPYIAPKKQGPPQNEMIGNNRPPAPPNGGPGGELDIFGDIQHNLLRFSLVFLISLLLKTNERWRKTEQEKTEAELSFLKAQVNPHFLFNTLNGIYSLAIEKSDNTADAVARLSGMMRFVTSEAGNDFVSLEKELNYLTNYIELQKIRFGNTVDLTVEIKGSTIGKKITPLILITFIENAFKYGVNPEEDSFIKISIEIIGNNLSLKVVNKIVQVQPAKVAATSLGIENTRQRLEYIYPGQYDLNIEEKENLFSVFLNIKL